MGTLFISPHFAEGSDSGARNGLATGAARWVFSLLLNHWGFLGRVFGGSACGICMNRGLEEVW